jgi:hypothetical protein
LHVEKRNEMIYSKNQSLLVFFFFLLIINNTCIQCPKTRLHITSGKDNQHQTNLREDFRLKLMPEQGNLIRVRSITLQQFMDTPLKDKKKKRNLLFLREKTSSNNYEPNLNAFSTFVFTSQSFNTVTKF